MNKLLISLLLLTVLVRETPASPVMLNEKYLSEAAQRGSPNLDQLEAAFNATKVRQGELKEEYAPELFGRTSYAETNERALISFQPIFSPVAQAQLGVRQKFAQGVTTTAQIVTDQRTSTSSALAGTFRDATTTTLSFIIQLDLWKNLFGRVSKVKLESAELDSKRAEIEKDIQTKAYKIALRRIYWSLVANQEALKISEELLKTAQRQSSEINLRFKNAVAEADEVARYQAQVASRQGTLLYLQYQRETLIKQLRNLLPELSMVELALDQYDLGKTMDEVLACTAIIATQTKVPYQFTRYDEIVEMLRKIRLNNAVVNSRYSDVDLQLYGAVKATGVSSEEFAERSYRGSFGGSIDDIQNNNRSGYEVGLQFSLPLDSTKENTQRSKEIYDDKRLLASINSTDAQVMNTHNELVKSIRLLNDVIRSQRVTSQELNKRLIGMRRKYQQARVSVNDLIMDQDALLNSELTTIETQLQILNTLFDYLVVYTETPCDFNRN
jgi:outer membrane protein TolC